MTKISDNLIAAFIDGNTTPEETIMVLEEAKKDKQLREFLAFSRETDEDIVANQTQILPVTALAATGQWTNTCVVLCELFILKTYNIERTIKDWETQAFNQGWLKDGGIALFNIGRMLEQECLSVSRQFNTTLDDIKHSLSMDRRVIAVVDGKELTSGPEKIEKERKEDHCVRLSPNHAVVVIEVNDESNQVVIYDPSKEESQRIYPVDINRFEDAWEDSYNYVVIVNPRDFMLYEPHPIDLSDVELPEELEDLREAIAENAHEVWALGRKKQGWSYGPERNDTLKQTPDMVPYSDLTDEEKLFDREMAMNTIKLLRKLGYKIEKL